MSIHRIITLDLIFSELEFSTSRSSGPGGQNVNKVNSKVTLRWGIKDSPVLTPEEKELLLQKLAGKITLDGELIITSQEKRSQLQNKEEVLIKLQQLLTLAVAKKKKRKITKPSKSAIQDRLHKKKIISEKKKWRKGEE